MYVCTSIFVCMYEFDYVCMYMNVCTCMNLSKYVCIHACMLGCTCLYCVDA